MEGNLSLLENKILQQLKLGNTTQGMDLFLNTFGAEKLPAIDFVEQCFSELNRQGKNEEAFELINCLGIWTKRNSDVTRMMGTAKKVFYESLVTKGSSIVGTAKRKLQEFAKGIPSSDLRRRELIDKENCKTLEDLYTQALEPFKKAAKILPESLGALSGMFRCYKELRNQAEADTVAKEIERIFKDISPQTTGKFPEELGLELKPPSEGEPPHRPAGTGFVHPDLQVEMQRIREFVSEERRQDALAALDVLLLGNPFFIPGILLKASILTEMRNFRSAQRAIDEALKIDSRDKTVQDARIDFLEKKFKLLVAGASDFLSRGLNLGTVLGRRYFEEALQCINQGLEICPNDISLLDQRYTCLIYLGRMEDARDARKNIYMVSPNFVTTFDRKTRSAFCFLAGYAFENRELPLEDFREIRRGLLLPFAIGRNFVSWYCRCSPALVATASTLGIPPSFFRIILWPIRLLGKCLKKRLISRFSRTMP